MLLESSTAGVVGDDSPFDVGISVIMQALTMIWDKTEWNGFGFTVD